MKAEVVLLSAGMMSWYDINNYLYASGESKTEIAY